MIAHVLNPAPESHLCKHVPLVNVSFGVNEIDDSESQLKSFALDSVNENQFDDFIEDLNEPACVQKIYDFAKTQVRGMVDYNDEDDVIQEVFYRLARWPIGKKYNSTRHYFSLLKITIRQAIAAYWKRRHSGRNDTRRKVFISELSVDQRRFDAVDVKTKSGFRHLSIKDLVHQVLQHVDTLSPKLKWIFQMRFIEEKSHEDIAADLGVSIRTSYRLETKLRELLRARFP